MPRGLYIAFITLFQQLTLRSFFFFYGRWRKRKKEIVGKEKERVKKQKNSKLMFCIHSKVETKFPFQDIQSKVEQ